MKILETLLIACVPATISGIISFVLAKSQAKSENSKLQLSNQHEIERLMEQHKVNTDAIREQYRLEMDSKKEHQYKLEIMLNEHENELIRQEKEQENTAKYNAMGNAMTGLFNGLFSGAMNSPEVQSEISQKILEGINQNSKSEKMI